MGDNLYPRSLTGNRSSLRQSRVVTRSRASNLVFKVTRHPKRTQGSCADQEGDRTRAILAGSFQARPESLSPVTRPVAREPIAALNPSNWVHKGFRGHP